MSLASKILLGFIALAAIAFFFFATLTLGAHANWRAEHDRLKADVDRFRAESELLADSESAAARARLLEATQAAAPAEIKPGIRQLKADLHGVLIDRGRVWYGAIPLGADANTGIATVELPPEAEATSLPVGAIVFVFEEHPIQGSAENQAPGEYLGEFKVTTVDEAQRQVTLEPAVKLNERELARVARRQGPWSIYDTMPADRHDVLSGMDNAALAEYLRDPVVSQAVRDEYLKDGHPAAPDEPAERVIGQNYVRALRDYHTLFQEHYRERAVSADRVAALEQDLKSMAVATEDANRQIAFRQAEIAQLNDELQESSAERDLAKSHLDAVEARLKQFQTDIEQTLADNKRLAAEWETLQLEAAERISTALATQNTQ